MVDVGVNRADLTLKTAFMILISFPYISLLALNRAVSKGDLMRARGPVSTLMEKRWRIVKTQTTTEAFPYRAVIIPVYEGVVDGEGGFRICVV